MVDHVYRTRSLGTAAEGLPDQYADGKAAKLWEVYVGDKNSRTEHYKSFLLNLLHHKNCKRVLDVACGTGIDSVMLVEEGFSMTSVDASDKMLKYALKTRWNRRKEPFFDKWVIEEANWLTLVEDCLEAGICTQESGHTTLKGFDALYCLGNSFAHLPDFTGNQAEQKIALKNFAKCVRPGGIFIIDHRNYDYILDTGKTPSKNIYYNSSCISEIQTSTLYKNGEPRLITLDYVIDVSTMGKKYESYAIDGLNRFRLSYYPHRLESFKEMLMTAFEGKCKISVYGDFKPLGEIKNPAFYIHVVEKLAD